MLFPVYSKVTRLMCKSEKKMVYNKSTIYVSSSESEPLSNV